MHNGTYLKLRNKQSLENIFIIGRLLFLIGKSHQINKMEPLGIALKSVILDFFPKLLKLNGD